MSHKDRTTMRAALTATLLAMSLLLMPVMSANAGGLPPEEGSLTIVKYVGAVGDTSNPIDGVVFRVYKVDTSSGMPATGSGITYRLNGSTLEVYDSGSSTPAVPVGTYPVTGPTTMTTGSDGPGKAVANPLPQGLYLVVEDLAASAGATDVNGDPVSISSAYKPFLVAVPMTNSTGDGWDADVVVYPKNEAVSIGKTVDVRDGDAVAVGDRITYTIESTVPSDIATSAKYKITDVLDPALTLDGTSVKVYAVAGTEQLLTAGTHYTLTSTNNTLTVDITSPAGMAYLGPDGFRAQKVKVTFDAVVNSGILSKPGFSVGNDAKLEFTNSSGVEVEAGTGGGGPTVHTAAITVSKVDENGSPLGGSEFKIATSVANAAAGRYLRIDPSTKRIYDYDASPTSTYATLGAANDYVIKPVTSGSPATAKDTFIGLKDFDGGLAQTYYLVETKAPSTYNILDKPVVVTFDGTEVGYTAQAVVNNSKGFTLPSTGGAGTWAFTLGGALLLGLSLAIALSRRSRRRNGA